MIYTCYEMLRDCRAGKVEGWSHFTKHYLPAMRMLVAHYSPQPRDEGALLASIRDFLKSVEPCPERHFMFELRRHVLSAIEPPKSADTQVSIEQFSAALASFTVVEKQAVWLAVMHWNQADAARMLRMAPETVEKIRERADEAIGAGRIAAYGPQLRQAVRDLRTNECLPFKAFLDIIDGRATWLQRDQVERHVINCWHCVDRFCCLREVHDILHRTTSSAGGAGV